jgi:hypothetical protein
MRGRDLKTVALVVVGVLALAGAGWFGYLTLGGGDDDGTAAAASPLATRRVVSTAGGFSIRVPEDLTVTRASRSVRLTSRGKDLVVSVGPIGAGRLPRATAAFLDTVRSGYAHTTVLGHRKERVDGRKARTTYGQVRARNGGPRLRFVVVTVAARPHNYALTAFTAHDSDPAVVLPRVDAIVNSFHVRHQHR